MTLPPLDRYPDPCRCLPGSEATGWHEIRCAACRAVDKAVWARALRLDLRAFLADRVGPPA